ncbi:hypothetical protein PybrP1_009894 [[Pythium] brassicae (nom. inval.)]|nr:hypothetical protein PybrP1_009894 [[Pythium] brassicae (nom. inval.)]
MIAHSHFERPSIRLRIQRVQLPTRKQLLDKYNSISGNVVSVFIKPLEYFAAVVLALALLCFATEFAVSSHTTRYSYVLLALAAGTGYLLSTGFNAINVQLAPRPIDVVVSAQDLSLSTVGDAIVDSSSAEQKRLIVAANLSNRTLLEDVANNPITNTVFRNWALPLEVNPPTHCAKPKDKDVVAKFGGISSLFRIPGRAWYSEALPVALNPSKQLTFVAEYPSLAARVVPNPGANSNQAPELPMARTRAMKLLVDAIHNTDHLFIDQPGWGQFRSNPAYVAQSAFRRQFGDKNTSGMRDADYPTLTDLLLSDARASRGAALSDADFLQMMANLTVMTFTRGGVRGPAIDVELTHFDLSDNLMFDAITVEFPSQKGFLQQRLMLNVNGSAVVDPTPGSTTGDQYFELDALKNCSLHACALRDKSSNVKPQIIAIRTCVDDAERDATRFKYESPYQGYGKIICTNTSNTSLVVVSVGVRIEGDEISHATLSSGDGTRQIIRLKNARKVFSVTVGRLSWEPVDLAALYGAECAGPDKSLCHGVRYKLAHSEGTKRRHVLVSNKRVPLDALSDYYYNFNDVAAKYLSLVELPATDSSILTQEDMVLPRRFARSSLPRSSDAVNTACSYDVEDFLFHMEMNHLYIEKSLQPAYAAAVFFLFQDGVVRDEVDGAQTSRKSGTTSSTTGRSAVTLAFFANRQLVDVRMSSPLLNVVFTLVGCGFLLLLSVAVAAASKASENRLERLADAHNVVEMLVDTSKYPTLLLKKTITDDVASDRKQQEGTIGPRDSSS